MRRPYSDFKTLNASLLPHIEMIVRSIDGDARLRGAELWFTDPGKGDDAKRDSASINVRTGNWHARATDNRGGDVISLVAYLRGTRQAEAAQMAAQLARVELPRRAAGLYKRTTWSGANAYGSSRRPPGAPPSPEGSQERAAKLWAQGQAIKGTVCSAYLQSRGIVPSVVLDDELRIIPGLAYYNTAPDGSPRQIGSCPAILAPIRDGLTGELSGVLRIWVSPDGSCKAHIVDHDTGETQTPKKLAGKLASGGIWFGLPGDTLVMCEGLEDALSLRQATGLPVVATSGWQQMGKTTLPSIVKRLIVVPDDNSDPDDPSKHNVGEWGLEQAARTYGALGIVVLVARLPDGKDSNDVLCTEGAEALAFAVEHAQAFDPTEQRVADEPPLPEFDEAFGEGAAGSGELTEDSVALDFEGTNKGKFLFNATRGLRRGPAFSDEK